MYTFLENGYRYELKFILNSNIADILKYRLSLLMDLDEHAEDGHYYIRSLYFDDINDTLYYEKINGLAEREKYRIRYYNFDKSYIVLELKGKKGDLSYKKQDRITEVEFNYIIDKEYDKIDIDNREVLEEFITKAKRNNYVPSVIVDYERVAYTYKFEDVRITFDYNISTGAYNYDFFNKDINTYKVLGPKEVLLEVKFNNKLPNIIDDIIKTVPMMRIAMSKFALCKEKKEVWYDYQG